MSSILPESKSWMNWMVIAPLRPRCLSAACDNDSSSSLATVTVRETSPPTTSSRRRGTVHIISPYAVT